MNLQTIPKNLETKSGQVDGEFRNTGNDTAITHLSAEGQKSSPFLVTEIMTDTRKVRYSERTTQVTEIGLV